MISVQYNTTCTYKITYYRYWSFTSSVLSETSSVFSETSSVSIPQEILSLLKQMHKCGEVSLTQMAMGFTRMGGEYLEDLALDVPEAPERFQAIVGEAKQDGKLTSFVNLPPLLVDTSEFTRLQAIVGAAKQAGK